MLEKRLLLTGCSSIQVFNSRPFPKHGQLDHTWWPAPHCAALVCLTGHYATPLVTKCFPPNLCLEEQRISLGVTSILAMCLCSLSYFTSHLKVDSVYVLEAAAEYYIYLSLVLNSLYYQ